MAGAVAVGATAALALPLLFSSFSPVDKACKLLPSFERNLLRGLIASLTVELNHNNFYCMLV